jgi:hypothetical protein
MMKYDWEDTDPESLLLRYLLFLGGSVLGAE